MRKLVACLVAAVLLSLSAPAFAAEKQTPGDGGFFTKFANDILGDSSKRGTPDKATNEKASQPACATAAAATK